jgi:molybdopterin-guanine dinucleotide biosynthesis protein A
MIVKDKVDVVIPESSNGLEPLHAVYRRETCLPFVQEALQQEQRRLIGWLDKVNVHVMTTFKMDKYDPDQDAFININTPDDLSRAELHARNRT